MSPKQRDAFLERAKQHSDITFLEENEIAKQLPHLTSSAGLWIPHAMVVDPQSYLEALRRLCLQEGAQFVQQEVRLRQGTTWHGFDLPEGFDTVVIAMGAGACQCPQLATFALRMIKGQVLTLSWPKELPPLEYPLTGDCYILPSSQGSQGAPCLVGATFEKQFTSPLPDRMQAETLLRPRLEAIAPQFASTQCLEVRAGVRLTTPQHTPIAQQVAPGLWALTALGSKGLLHHALLARRLAGEIVTRGR